MDFTFIFLSGNHFSYESLRERRCWEQVADAYKPTVKIGFPPLQVMNNSTWEATTHLERKHEKRTCLNRRQKEKGRAAEKEEAGGVWRRWSGNDQ